MVSVIFRAKMKPGKEDEAVEKMTKMVEAVKANEPGALIYAFHRMQDDPSEMVFFEVYADDDAFRTHTGTPHFMDLQRILAQVADLSTVRIERLDRIAGFAR